MRNIGRFALATLAFVALSAVFLVVGNNIGVNGTFEWNTFGESFGIFGGVISFLAILGVIVILGIAFAVMRHLAQINKNNEAAGVGIALTIVALIVGASWVRIDLAFFGGIWPILGYVAFAVVATAIIGAILGANVFTRRTANLAAPTT